VIQIIDEHRDRFGVEPICRVLTENGVPIARRATTRSRCGRDLLENSLTKHW